MLASERLSVSFSTIPNVYPRAAGPSAVSFNWRLAVSSIAIGCAYLAASWHVSGPAYLRDEIGYLANAAFLAGYRIDAASSFHAGYSFFIAPAFLLSDPKLVWKGVLTINAILWAGSFAMLYALLRRLLPHAQPLRLLTVTIVSALYPTCIISSGYAFATTAFAFLFLASLLALFLWSRDNPLSVLPHATLVGYLYWVHPTGAAVALVSVVAVALGAWRWRDARPLLLHVALAAALILAYQRGVHPWMVASMTPPGYSPEIHYPSLASALNTLLTWRGFAVFATMAAGQFAYVIVAGFGLTLAGLLFCARQLWGARNDESRQADDVSARSVWLLIGAAPLGVIALGAIAFFHWDHFEGHFWIYGRYLDGAILPVLAIGLAVFQPDIRLAVASIFLLAVGLVLASTVPSGAEHDIADTVAFWPQYVSRNAGFLTWMLLGAVAVAAVAHFGRRLAIALMAASFALSLYHQTVWHNWFLTDLSAPSPLVETIRSTVPPGACVGVNPMLPAEATLLQRTRYRLNAFYLFDYAYRRMSPAEWLTQCAGPYLSYDGADLEEIGGVRRVARDPKSGLLLVRKADGAKAQSASEPSQ
jgi:hypothetical protein